MRISSRGTALVLGAALIVSPSTLRADELVMMPFACAVVGGRPLLTPSETEGYRILGRREQREFTACSPVDPGMCRRWVVHRFDIDCGGQRVPWTEVIANAQPGARAWVDNGQLNLRMPPRWTMDPTDPCARLSDYYDGRWRDPRMRHYCADRRSLAPPPYVAMPVGFAPMLGIDAVFVAAAPSPSSGPPLPPSGYNSETNLPPKIAKPAPAKSPAHALAKPAEKEPAPSKAVAREPTPPVQPAPPAPSSAGAPPQGTPAAPRIINRAEPEAPRPAPSAAAAEPVRTALAPPPPPTAPAEAKPEPPSASAPAAPKVASSEQPPPQVIEVSLVSRLQTPVAAGALAALGVLLVGAAFFVLRRREQVDISQAREFASISLGDPGEQAAGTALQVTPQPRDVAATPSPASWGPEMPRTRADALAVLGMGVTAGATSAAIKKIVDGLRQSWHPDLARDESDREMRELRSKQINAAWQILATGETVSG